MTLVDLLLNAAALLLWVSWRSAGFVRTGAGRTPFSPLVPAASPGDSRRHFLLMGLLLLLLSRSWIYWRLGAEVGWIASVNLGIVTLSFKSLLLSRMVIYSYLTFGVWLFSFHVWLLMISVINRRVPDTDSWQRSVRQHLGWMEAWPALLKLTGPWMLVALLWFLAMPGLVRLGLAAPARTTIEIWQQGALVGLGTSVVWKYLIGGLLLLHVINSYLYLGNRPWWTYVNTTARNLLRPIRWLPLRFGRMDFAPILGIALTFLGFELLEAALKHLFGRLPL